MAKIMLVIEEFSELRALEGTLKKMGFDVLSMSKEVGVSEGLMGFFPDVLITSLKGKFVDGEKVILKVKKVAPQCRVALLFSNQNQASLTDRVRQMSDAMIESPIEPLRALQVIATLGRLDVQVLTDKYQKLMGPKKNDSDVVHVKTSGTSGKTQESAQFVKGPKPTEDIQRVKGAGGKDHEKVSVSGHAGAGLSTSLSSEKSLTSSVAAPGKKLSLGEQLVEHVEKERAARYKKCLEEISQEPVDKVIPHSIFAAAQQQASRASAQEKQELENLYAAKKEFVKALFGGRR